MKIKNVRVWLSNGTATNVFQNYFHAQDHEMNTRNNRKLITIPKIKTEYARKSFYFMGAKIYNTLPLEARSLGMSDFKTFLNEHFN